MKNTELEGQCHERSIYSSAGIIKSKRHSLLSPLYNNILIISIANSEYYRYLPTDLHSVSKSTDPNPDPRDKLRQTCSRFYVHKKWKIRIKL